MSAPTHTLKADCVDDHDDVAAVKSAIGTANLVFIITLVLGILSCGSAGFAMWRGMGMPMTIAAAILGLVGSIVSAVFFFQKGDLEGCLVPISSS